MGYWSARHHLPTWSKSHRARAARLSSFLYILGMTVRSLFWEFVRKSETPEGFPPVGSEQKPHSLSFQFCPFCSLPSLSVGSSWPGSKFMVLTLFHVYESQYICKWNLTPCFRQEELTVSFREKSLSVQKNGCGHGVVGVRERARAYEWMKIEIVKGSDPLGGRRKITKPWWTIFYPLCLLRN